MQRYDGKWLVPNFFLFFAPSCSDRQTNLRQTRPSDPEFVAKIWKSALYYIVVLSQKQPTLLTLLTPKLFCLRCKKCGKCGIKSGYGNYIYARAYVRTCREFVRWTVGCDIERVFSGIGRLFPEFPRLGNKMRRHFGNVRRLLTFVKWLFSWVEYPPFSGKNPFL